MERAKALCVEGCICEIERTVHDAVAQGELVWTVRYGVLVAVDPKDL